MSANAALQQHPPLIAAKLVLNNAAFHMLPSNDVAVHAAFHRSPDEQMSESPLIALVVGGTGVVGRYIIKHLASPASRFQLCYSCSRRPADVSDSTLSPKLRSIQVDLLNGDGAEDGRVNLGRLGITHLFFAGYAGSVEVAPNLAMLENALSALDGPTLQHVHLVEGTKWYGYGVLPGPFKNPAKESDPRCLIDLFYYHQQDLLESRVARADCKWTWSASRPHAVVGFSVGSAMNIVLAVAVYAAVCKELGMPLHFPGTQATFDAVYQMTDSTLLARGIEHLSTQPQCVNQAVNITNGDYIRWRNVWPRVAAVFGMECGIVRTMKLTEVMSTPDKARLWQRLADRHNLNTSVGGYTDLVPSWNFADFVMHAGVDVMSDTGKSRRLGFMVFEDTEEMLVRELEQLISARVVPGK